ncbi:rCG26475 [Rattus norvegicus]|uniref:RCG26475 n=1 Tax=Rattus norvegicus TaxID=10116 RepID=A6HM00_RAT|nr:rCG26475 [Rattus norvegicus]
MIWVAVVGDWFNLVFKWILSGHCPYWWIQETEIYPNHSSPCLEQIPTPCETGPGSPCGLAMGSSCVWYVMVTAALNYTVSWMDESSNTLHRDASSRGLQTHSRNLRGQLECVPEDQCLPLPVCIHLFFFFFLVLFFRSWGPAFTFYLLLRLLGIALLWSVSITKKCCANSDWIHIDSMPFAGLVRNLRVLFGLGFSINSEMFLLSCQGKKWRQAEPPLALCSDITDHNATLLLHQDPNSHGTFILPVVFL